MVSPSDRKVAQAAKALKYRHKESAPELFKYLHTWIKWFRAPSTAVSVPDFFHGKWVGKLMPEPFVLKAIQTQKGNGTTDATKPGMEHPRTRKSERAI